MVRKSSRKNKGKKSKPAAAGAPSLNDRGRYQPQHKKTTATGPSSAKAAKKSKKSVDTMRCVAFNVNKCDCAIYLTDPSEGPSLPNLEGRSIRSTPACH